MREAVRQSAIGAMFVLLYDRDPATKAMASTMSFPTLDGGSATGIDEARDTLLAALATDPSAWAEWLADPEQNKIVESFVLALGLNGLDSLSNEPGTERLMARLREMIIDLTAARTHA